MPHDLGNQHTSQFSSPMVRRHCTEQDTLNLGLQLTSRKVPLKRLCAIKLTPIILLTVVSVKITSFVHATNINMCQTLQVVKNSNGVMAYWYILTYYAWIQLCTVLPTTLPPQKKVCRGREREVGEEHREKKCEEYWQFSSPVPKYLCHLAEIMVRINKF